jgi:carboxymethylenebutenolidase
LLQQTTTGIERPGHSDSRNLRIDQTYVLIDEKIFDHGYMTIAPALFDRVDKDTVLEYSEAGASQGRLLVARLKPEHLLLDIQAVINHFVGDQKVAVIGYCRGGSVAYLAACRLQIDAGIAYYGTRIHQMLNLQPNCPFMFHFGGQDKRVPSEAVDQIRQANPSFPLYVYPHA